MRRFTMLTAAIALLALPCFAEVFVLQDGTEIEGTVTRTSADGHVTIRTSTGIRTHHVSEFAADTREKHFANLNVRETTPATPPRMTQTQRTQTEPDTKTQEGKPKAVLGLMTGGAILIGIGSLWMLIAAFAETPVWGIAFLLSAGLAELAFVFVHWDRAKSPLFTQIIGVALFAAAFLIAR